ncbi:hypothetical protein BRC81_04050 [Halobacteriales archaeon QS_1_68_20]|nr:MAG: hypothetical protein BRC81_04050 [Halobacteriales archaeon QS_1_68_20]
MDASESGAGERVVTGYDSVDGVDWAVVSYGPPSTLFATADQVGRNLLIMLGIIAVMLAGFGIVVERPTIRAMNERSDTARALRDGDLETSIETDRRDEIGEVFGGSIRCGRISGNKYGRPWRPAKRPRRPDGRPRSSTNTPNEQPRSTAR